MFPYEFFGKFPKTDNISYYILLDKIKTSVFNITITHDGNIFKKVEKWNVPAVVEASAQGNNI